MASFVAFVIGVLVAWFVASLRMGFGMRIVRFTARQERFFTLIKDGPFTEHEMQIRFSLSKFRTIVNWLTLFPPKREPATAEIRFRCDDETRWLYRGIWRDTGTIETIVNDVCIKSLFVATYHKDKWFPINEIDAEPLPNSFTIEVQLRSQRDGKPLGEPIQEEIVTEGGVLTKQGIVIR
jgi:hypothetical protein